MERKAFELIQDKLQEALLEQGFGEAIPIEEDGAKAVLFTTGDVGYGLFYEVAKKRFVLKSTVMRNPKEPGDWRQLSVWLYDEKESTADDAESIANDFLDIVGASKRRKMVVNARKNRKKDEENNADPQFFLNRMVPVFPELRVAMNEERIVYGQVRTAKFAAEKLAPLCEQLAKQYPESDSFARMVTILCDLYGNGDMDTRSIIVFGVLNHIKDQTAIDNITAAFTEGCDLQKMYKHGRKLMDKPIRPEKPKKQKKVEARLER